MNIDIILKQLNIVEKAALKPFKSWDKQTMIYPGGVPDKEFPKGYEGGASKYVHPKSGADMIFDAIKPKGTGKTSYFDPRTGYTHVKIADLQKRLDNIINKLEK